MDFDKMQKYYLDAKYGLPKDASELFNRLRINLSSHFLDYIPLLVVAVLIVSTASGDAAKFLFVNIFAIVAIVAAYIVPPRMELDRNLTLACYAGAALLDVLMFYATEFIQPEFCAFGLAVLLAAVHAAFRPCQTLDKLQDKVEHPN